MVRKFTIPKRTPWEDRFTTPKASTLIGELSRAHATLVGHIRQRLVQSGLRERVAWHGVPWRWTLMFDASGDPRPAALIIPQPGHPALAIPVVTTRALEPKRTPKWILEAIVFSPLVAGVHWPRWELTGGKSQADALLETLVLSPE